MSRIKRSERLLQLLAPQAPLPPGPIAQRHLRCPMCGLQARPDLIEAGPYEVEARVQHYGGYGNITWDPPEPATKAELGMVKVHIQMVADGQHARRSSPLQVEDSSRSLEGEPEVTSTSVEALLERLRAKWASSRDNARKRKAELFEADLEEIEKAGRDTILDVVEVRGALEEYQGLERADYDSAEDYREARQEVWEAILDALDALEVEGD